MEGGSEENKTSFIKHVFNFDEDTKSELSNLVQYSILALIPVILLNKLIQKYVPEADDEKGSLEITGEIFLQVLVMFTGLFFIHRIITYVPTYSGVSYPELSFIYIVLGTLLIVLSLQTKLGEKVSILVDRILELWDGHKSDDKGKQKSSGSVKVKQPISGSSNASSYNQQAISQAMYTDGTSLQQLPSLPVQEQSPNFNKMYKNDSTPLVNANTPGQGDMYGGFNEPMPANMALGTGAFNTW